MDYLILGGTGTLGTELTRQLLQMDDTETITIFSRCELKQKQFKAKFNSDKIRFKIGDIRDKDSLQGAIDIDIDTVFHVAAMKHIDTCEEHIEECIKTNILGTINVINVVKENLIPNLVFSSTDKAVDPVNVYGMCKGISEKLVMERSKDYNLGNFIVYRWGNVLGSNGSFLHQIKNKIEKGGMLEVTDLTMTRFWIHISDAVKFMLDTFRTADPGVVQIPYMKASTVGDLIKAVEKYKFKNLESFREVGARLGEKFHERLYSGEGYKREERYSSERWEKYSEVELNYLVQRTLEHLN